MLLFPYESVEFSSSKSFRTGFIFVLCRTNATCMHTENPTRYFQSSVISQSSYGLPSKSLILFKINNRNTRKRCGICPKLTIKILERP